MEKSVGLNEWQSLKNRMVINRIHALIHGAALAALFYYRITSISISKSLPHLLIFAAELVLSFQWLLSHGAKWNPVSRTTYPDRLPADDKLPSVDVFVCTTDPVREPSLGVMNTVISAMALDYPPHKLHVYLSDDGGSSVTLRALQRARSFAKVWLPFCKKYEVKNRCPQAYFLTEQTGDDPRFLLDKTSIQNAYEDFKISLAKIAADTDSRASIDHQPVIEVINDGDEMDKDPQMPLLVYVAREKRPFHPHHFKAGALNVLLRVSALISNSPYILVLDCDMYCNDPKSARQAMCFHLDPKLSPDLAFVQFPQRFHNLCDKDIYDSEFRHAWEKWEGLDGLNGPILSGSGFYMKREALYRSQQLEKNVDTMKRFGSSKEFINSVYTHNKPNCMSDEQKEMEFLASCRYEKGSKWGEQVGFRYFAVVEDYFTGLNLHCEGWKSVYYESSRARPSFSGTAPENLGEALVQQGRWYVGLNQVAYSKYSPLVYGVLKMPILQSMTYAENAFFSISFLPLYILALLPQISLLHGIHLYPQLSSPFFFVFLFLFVSLQAKHLQEVLMTGYRTSTWITEQRMWTIRCFTAYLYANVDTIMDKIGWRKASFLLTSKAVDEAAAELYRKGMYNFDALSLLILPMCTLYMINMGSFVAWILHAGKGNGMMLIESLIPLFGMILHLPLLQGMVVRKDKGRVPTNVSIVSLLLSSIVMAYASFAT